MQRYIQPVSVRRIGAAVLMPLIILFCIYSSTRAGENQSGVRTEGYLSSRIPSQFDSVFHTPDSKKDFKALREFLREKSELLNALLTEDDYVSDRTADSEAFSRAIGELENLIKGKGDEVRVTVPNDLISPMLIRNPSSRVDASGGGAHAEIRVVEIKAIIADDSTAIRQLHEETVKQRTLQWNIKAVRQDVNDCTNAIEAALTPEYAEQKFRENICAYFSLLIAAVLFLFFYIVYRRSDSTLSKELLSGTGLQFVTLFVLIIAVILFGILGILKGSELAAILSGISGYILGKGTARAANAATPPNNGKPGGPAPEPAAQAN